MSFLREQERDIFPANSTSIGDPAVKCAGARSFLWGKPGFRHQATVGTAARFAGARASLGLRDISQAPRLRTATTIFRRRHAAKEPVLYLRRSWLSSLAAQRV